MNNKTQNILIHGHSDSQAFVGFSKTESDYLNWQLFEAKVFVGTYSQKLLPRNQKRADSVKAALAWRGVLQFRMKTFGYGSSRPLVSGDSEAALAQNRRVEIEVGD
jgi:flagellar motor protein MotB